MFFAVHHLCCIMQQICTGPSVCENKKTLDFLPCNMSCFFFRQYSKTCVKRPLSKRTQIGLQDQLSLNAGQKHCRMSILQYFRPSLSYPFVFKIFCFEWPFYTGFAVNEVFFLKHKVLNEHFH